MTYPYNTFEAWLQAHGLGSYLDGDGELKDGTSQGFFSSQYTGWLADLINYYGEAIRNQYGLPADCQFLVSINQSDPNGLPVISGLTQAQVDDLFDDTSAFSWTSGSKPAIHTRYYSNSFNVQALEVNHAPTADNVQAGSAEDAGSIAIALTGSDPDSGDAIESFTLTSLPPATAGVLFTDSALSNAAVTGVAYTATGEALTLYFVPASNFYGKVEFTYNASDGALASTEAATTITVTQVNDAAGFGGDTTGNGNEDSGAILGTLTVSDVADGMTVPNFRIESGDGPSDGVAIIDANTGQWNYTPNANFNGADHFMVSVTDDDGNVETRVVDITVNPTPDAAVAHDDAFTASEDFGVSGNVLANDSNLDNETLTVVALSGVSAADSLTRIVVSEIMANPVGVSDADGEWFEVYNAGAFPVDLNGWTIQIGGHPILIDSPTPLLVAPGSFFVVAANGDSTANGGLPFVGYETGPLGLANGGTTIVLFDGDGHEIDSVDYSGSSFPPDQEGYSFSLLDAAADNNQGEFWQNTSNSDLYGVAGNHGTPWAPPLVFGGGDAAGDPPVIGEPAIFPSGALLTLNSDGTFNFDSNGAYDYLAKGQTTTEQFSYTLSDGHGGLQTATVTLTIDGKNDAPVSVGETFATTEDVPLVAGSVLANDSDVDVGTVLTASLVDAPGHGSITLNSNGTFSYIPDANFNGTDSFTYVANDGLADSNVATVTIDVFAANDAPVAQGDQFTTSSANQLAGNVLLNDSDVDGDSLMAVSLAGLSPQDVVPKIVISEIMPNPTGVPDADGEWFEVYNAGGFPVDLNGWTIQIDGHPILIDNSTPLVILPGSFFDIAANDDPALNGGLPFVGYETGPLGLANSGSTIVLFDGNGREIDSVDYGGSAFPQDREGFSFSLLDAAADNNQGEFWQNTPNSNSYGVAGNYGTPGAPPLVFGGGDPISPPIGQQITLASGALLTLNADGAFLYEPNGAFDDFAAGETATDGFAYTISDGHGGVDTAVATITVTGPNAQQLEFSNLLL